MTHMIMLSRHYPWCDHDAAKISLNGVLCEVRSHGNQFNRRCDPDEIAQQLSYC